MTKVQDERHPRRGETMKERLTEAMSAVRPNIVRLTGAAFGMLAAWWTGLSAIAQALLIVQGADVLTGLLCALCGRSRKTQSGRVSSGALTMGVIKKGLEWLVVAIGVYVGEALEMQGIAGAAMTYMIATELVSLMENLALFGLDVPVLKKLLDIAQERDAM